MHIIWSIYMSNLNRFLLGLLQDLRKFRLTWS